MRRDAVLLILIGLAAFGIRTYPAWTSVYAPTGVNFLETDSWYHVRLVEHQVHNYPWRLTHDPYAAPGGQFVPIAPLFDTVTSTVVLALHGRDATSAQVERVAAIIPPLLGAFTVVLAGILARRLFGRREGLLAAALLAVLPGHFLDRTMLGFVDHHALEALLAVGVLAAFSRALADRSLGARVAAGVVLGLYLLAWGSGAFLVAIVGLWLLLFALLSHTREEVTNAAALCITTVPAALVLVLVFQDPAMYRYGSQVAGLAALGAIALAAGVVRGNWFPQARRSVTVALAVAVAAAVAGVWVAARDLALQVLIDVGRLTPDPTRMAVLEARPLFLYSGEWRWTQPWEFFGTGFFAGLIAAVLFAGRVLRERRAADLLVLLFAIAMFVATIGQNRFGYYLVPACALLGGWLAARILDWGGVPHAGRPAPAPHPRVPFARELAVVVVAGGMFAPNLAPRVLLAERTGTQPAYWRDAMAWLAAHTPAPFVDAAGAGEDFYLARYPESTSPLPDYSVMSWWDQGYWVIQQAHRVPVANPTQERAPNAARFFAETNPARAMEHLRAERARYVISDWELPFRKLADGTIMGRFESVADWAGAAHAGFYEILYRASESGWTPVWVFHEAYYRSMAFRLSVLGGRAAIPARAWVITVADRVDATGTPFRELLTTEEFSTYFAAVEAAATRRDAQVVGLDPWQTAVPLEAITGLEQVYESPVPQPSSEAPWVRIFEAR